MKKIVSVVMIALFVFSGLKADMPKKESMEYYKDFVRFLELSGAKESQATIVKKMFEQFKMMPNVKKSILDNMDKVLIQELDNLNHALFPVYQKYLSHKDLLEIIKFYESDAGKRLVKSQPMLLKDSFEIGSQWGQSVAKRVLQQ